MDRGTFRYLALAVVVMTVGGQSTQKPCLPDQTEFMGMDTKGRQSYEALDFNKRMFGMRRDGFRMVEDFMGISDHVNSLNLDLQSSEDAKRYDIEQDRCDVYNIDKNMDLPKCVPGNARQVSSKHGDGWLFRNIEGASLIYSVHNPSTIFEKISPDGFNSVTYFNSSSTITDSTIFTIPDRCLKL